MKFFHAENQALELKNADEYLNTIQRLEYFVHSVDIGVVSPLQTNSLSRTNILIQLSAQLIKSFDQHKFKVVKPWLHFIERINSSYKIGITLVHLNLLKILVKNHFYKPALSLVETPGLPITIQIHNYRHYLTLAAQVYIQLEKYDEALQSLNLAIAIDESNFDLSMLILKQIVLVRRIIGFRLCKQDFIKKFDTIRNYCQIMELDAKKIGELQFQFLIFCNICQGKTLQPSELQYLKKKQLFQLYQKGLSQELIKFKSYIQNQVRSPITYRIKCTQVMNLPVSSFNTVRKINKTNPIYKYDLKNGMMYFQRQQNTDEKIDSMINKACKMKFIISRKPEFKKGAGRQINEFAGFYGTYRL